MTKKPTTRPRGYRTCTTSLAVGDVDAALTFYAKAFDAEVTAKDSEENTQFATLKIGNSMLFVTQGWQATGHLPLAGVVSNPVSQHMYVDNIEAMLENAVKAGAIQISELQDTYWGEKCATIRDPFGHIWTIAKRIEQLSAGDLEKRRTAFLGLDQNDAADLAETPVSEDAA
jgi:PhnB protein